ncbi:MAG: AMP-binding protein [Planctomycetota bacterium]
MPRPWEAFYPSSARGSYPDQPLDAFVTASDRIALVDGEETWTYATLRVRIDEAAGWFAARGVVPGARVLLHLPNSVAFVVAYYGALRAGGIVSAASPELGEEAFRHQRDDVDPVLVVDAATEIGCGEPPPRAPHDIAVLQYTSGTTGTSKGAIMTHRNLVTNALQNARWFGWSGREVNLAVLPLCHTWGMCVCLNSTFAVGGTLVLARRFDPQETLAAIARHGATVLYGSATMFHRLLDVAAHAVPTLRHVKAGAMLTQGDLKARWDARYPHAPMQQGYGLTEASPESHNNPPLRFRAGTVGVPLPDTDCRIVAEDGRLLGPDEVGEVCLRGPQVSRGYWGRPARADAWLPTGDLGRMDADGYLTIVDRKKDMLKFRGYSVSPNVIEDCLLAHPAVAEAVVVGRPDERDGDLPVAYLVGDAQSDEAMDAHCRAALARYEVPRIFRWVDAIPKNHVGKPLRRALRTLEQ